MGVAAPVAQSSVWIVGDAGPEVEQCVQIRAVLVDLCAMDIVDSIAEEQQCQQPKYAKFCRLLGMIHDY